MRAHASAIAAPAPRLLMLAPFGIRPKGTLSARMLPLARALHRRGYAVSIIAPPVHNPQDANRHELIDGVQVYHTRLPRSRGPLQIIEQSLLLLRAALAYNPQLLHLFKPKGYSGLAALLAQHIRPNLPLILDTDDWEGPGGWNDLLPYPAAARAFFAWQERDLPRRAAAVTVASQALQTLVWSLGVNPAQVFLLPNGIDPQQSPGVVRPAAPGTPPTLLLYTRFWEFSLAPLVSALVATRLARPDLRLLVIGSGERGQEQTFAQLCTRAGLSHMLELRGWVEPQDIPALLARADLALAPLDDTLINRARGLAKLLELMAAGLPIISTSVGMAPVYLEHTRSGWIVPAHNPAALAAGMLELLANPALRRQLGQAARQRATSTFAWDQLANQAIAAYRLALRT